MPIEEVVSDPSERLVLVDKNDKKIGAMSKLECHQGKGTLHRAFSIFLYNANGELLLQQRSIDKPLWPLYWSNSCCSHPRDGEIVEEALQRRLQQELGITDCPLTYLYKFEYQASFGDVGAEHELCSVYIGQYNGKIAPNTMEIADTGYFTLDQIDTKINSQPENFTPWFKLEWQHVREHLSDIEFAAEVKAS